MFSDEAQAQPMTNFRGRLYERYVSTFKGRLRARRDSQDDLASYSAWCAHKVLPLLEEVEPHAPVLDLGCGGGRFMRVLARAGFQHVDGVDVSGEMVALANDAGLTVQHGDVLEFLRAGCTPYAAIVALDLVEHFTKDELMTLFPAIRDRLAPDGVFLIQTPNGEGLLPNHVIYGDLTHLTVFTPSSLEQLLRVCGFGEAEFFETGPTPKSLTGVVRVALWSAIKVAANVVKMIETGRRQHVWTENLICRCRRIE